MWKPMLLGALLMGLGGSAQAEEIKLWVKDVPFAPWQTAHLSLLSVQKLEAMDDRFGGLSALALNKGSLLALSDQGNLFRFNRELTSVDILPLLEKNDDPLEGKKRTDAESIAHAGDNLFYIAFERDHRIVPYNGAGYVMGKELNLPGGVSKLSKNGGLEAIETLRSGRLVIIAEGKAGQATTNIWVQKKSGKWKKKELALLDGFRPTGLARIPDRDDLVLIERFYSLLEGVRLRLSLLDPDKGERTEVLGVLSAPLPVDNFEGIVIDKDGEGRNVITLISDDNFNPLQRTLLMRLILQ